MKSKLLKSIFKIPRIIVVLFDSLCLYFFLIIIIICEWFYNDKSLFETYQDVKKQAEEKEE